MVKPPVPRLRLRVKTPVKTTAKARSARAPRPRDRKDANLNPLPDLNVSKVILPQVPPCDVILEYKKYHLTKTFLEKLLPPNIRACSLKLGGHKAEVQLAGASAPEGSGLAVLNAGCYVSCVAWSPCGLVLALAVHNREKPAMPAEGPVTGMGTLQLWRTDLGKSPAAQLRMGLVHEGACARSLQWLPSKRTQERLGLLLAALGNGEVCMYSLPRNAFDEKALSRALLFARFKPAWTASCVPTGADPAMWERHLQCAAVRADARDPHGATVAAGSEKSVVLIWRLKGKGSLETGPCEVLKPSLLDADMVVSLAWCPSPGEELLVAGLSGGYLVLWDLAVPVVPLRSFMPGSRNPMLNLSWNDASTLCLPSECVVLDLRDERTCQVRPHRGTAGRNLVRCTEMCHTPAGLLSVWSDGAVHLKPRCQINFGKENGVRGKGQRDSFCQCWAFSGNPDLNNVPFPHMAYDCPKDEAERREYMGKLFLEYEYELVNHLRLWEDSTKHTLETIAQPKEDVAMPLTCAAVTIPKSDGTFVLASGSAGGIVSLMSHKNKT